MDNDIETFNTFESMELDSNILRGIYANGFEKPSEIQKKGIKAIINNKDIICQAQSGTGKTATFTIALLQKIDFTLKQTQGIILAPTRELAHQIYSVAKTLSKYLEINICSCIGGTSIRETANLLKDSQIIIGTPGRIHDMINKKYISLNNIVSVILDEADEMLSKGFMEQIQDILSFVKKDTQICLMSATIPAEMYDITKKFMIEPVTILVKNDELTLEGINQFYISVEEERWKFDTLCDLYESININQAIIYCNTKRKVDWIYDKLSNQNFTCSIIHGEINNNERKDIMDKFRNGDIRILLTTDLLSRGIDVQQVSLVINYDLPNKKESYIHRIGRSGRYGRKGVAINFITKDDVRALDELCQFYSTDIKELPVNVNDFF